MLRARPDRTPQIAVVLAIVALTILAWAYLFHLDRDMREGMDYAAAMEAMGMSMAEPWTATDIWLAFVMWTAMMIGMMTPSAAPVILVVAKSGAARGEPAAAPTPMAFAAGYLTIWIGFSGAAAVAHWQLHEAAMLSPAMAARSSWISGLILTAAGAYQLTSLKRACLVHCRNPLDFLMTHWRRGVTGAFQMGLHHGMYCLGCCWALMVILFAVGIMNLAWVAAIAVFVLIEKTARPGALLSKLAGAALVATGVVILLRSWPPS